ncbi:MAG: hypothetical protein ABIU84_09640, partial [Thermoanaerobaculia bacterium]
MSGRSAFWIGVVLVAAAAALAGIAATGDSVTVDEPSHLVAGYSSLVSGDFRLSPDHPPLARWLLALPLLSQPVVWKPEGTLAWRSGDFLSLGRIFLEEWNDGQRLTSVSRIVAIGFLLLLLITVGVLARKLHGPGGALLTMAVVAF